MFDQRDRRSLSVIQRPLECAAVVQLHASTFSALGSGWPPPESPRLVRSRVWPHIGLAPHSIPSRPACAQALVDPVPSLARALWHCLPDCTLSPIIACPAKFGRRSIVLDSLSSINPETQLAPDPVCVLTKAVLLLRPSGVADVSGATPPQGSNDMQL